MSRIRNFYRDLFLSDPGPDILRPDPQPYLELQEGLQHYLDNVGHVEDDEEEVGEDHVVGEDDPDGGPPLLRPPRGKQHRPVHKQRKATTVMKHQAK